MVARRAAPRTRGSAASGTSRRRPGRRGRARCRDPGGGRVGEVGQAAVPVAVVEQDGPGGVDVELDQRLRLGLDVAVGQAGLAAARPRDRRRRGRGYGCSDGSLAIVRDRPRAGRPADRAARASPAGSRPRGSAAAVIAPQLWPTTWSAGTSSPAARIQAATSAALSRNRWWPVQWPVSPWPGRSTATTRRPVGASAGPTRHQIRADAVTPWIRTSGRSAGSPQSSAENGIPAASVVVRRPDPASGRRARRRPRRSGRQAGGSARRSSRHGSARVRSTSRRPCGTAGPARMAPGPSGSGAPTAEASMAKQFVVQLKNEPGAMATPGRGARGARRRPAGDRRREHGRQRPRDHDHRRRRDDQGGPRRAAATPTSRASRSWPRSTTGRAGWPAWRAPWPTPA